MTHCVEVYLASHFVPKSRGNLWNFHIFVTFILQLIKTHGMEYLILASNERKKVSIVIRC